MSRFQRQLAPNQAGLTVWLSCANEVNKYSWLFAASVCTIICRMSKA